MSIHDKTTMGRREPARMSRGKKIAIWVGGIFVGWIVVGYAFHILGQLFTK